VAALAAAAAAVALGANAIQQRHFNAQFVALPYGRRVTLDCLLRFPGRSDGGLRCRARTVWRQAQHWVSSALWQRMNGPAGYTPLSWRSSAAAVRSFSRVISAFFMRRACIALHVAPAPHARKRVCSTRSEARALSGMQGQKTTLPHYYRVPQVHGTRVRHGPARAPQFAGECHRTPT
jgi:hypothetical protein